VIISLKEGNIMDFNKYSDFIIDRTVKLLAIDSPTGYTTKAADFVLEEFKSLGFEAKLTKKGGVLVNLNPNAKTANNGLLLEAHTDTLGGMVSSIKSNGRLIVTPLGGMNANNAETENVRIITKFDGEYEGTFQLNNASIHVNGEYNDIKRSFDTCEVVIDEDVKSEEDTKKLGISVGDIVCFEPNTRVTKSGYIKSRFLDDKLSVGIILALAKCIKDEKIEISRPLYSHITVF
jgi:putative aminopeptidase FrvX